MSIAQHDFHAKQALDRVDKTATATLTQAEVDGTLVVGTHATVTIALTLPAAAGALTDARCFVANGGAASVTVAVAAGFGGAGSGSDTVTLARGELALFLCDGSYWYSLHHTTPG